MDEGYAWLYEECGRDRIESRHAWLRDQMEDYLRINKNDDCVKVSDDLLDHVIIDYFVDIVRLKEFQGIERVNEAKIYAYLSYWVLRHKPMQIPVEDSENLVYINEEFVSDLIESFLYDPADIPVSESKMDSIREFKKMLLYNLKYREYNAKSLELMIVAFNAGRGYQYSIDHM